MAEREPPLPELLRPHTFERAQVERIWSTIAAERAARRHDASASVRGLGLRLSFAVALTAGVAVVAVRVERARDTLAPTRAAQSSALSLTRSDGSAFERVAADGAASVRVALSDGSALDVQPGGLLVPVELSTRRVVLQLERGATHFAVRPGGPRRWVIEAGPARVEVVGTRFEVARGPDGTRVRVEEGKVEVHGAGLPGALVQLTVGQEVTVAARAQVGAPQRTDAAAIEHAEVAEAAAPAAPLAGEPGPAKATRSATPAVTSTPGPAPAPARADNVEALLAEADRLRVAREHAAAASVLERVLSEHADDPRAALAAFTLGGLRERSLGDARGAATAYARALALGLRGPLSQSARAHLAQALLAAGQRAQAAEAARDYLVRHPNGADAPAMRALVHAVGTTAADPAR